MTVRDPQPHRFFFVHIRKTAGSALRRRMINHFGEAAVYPTQGVDGNDPFALVLSVDHLRERLAARGDEIKVVTGHFPLCTIDLIDGRYTTLTLLRDPVERMLSSLRHDREVSPAVRGWPLEDIYDAGGRLSELAQNQMVKVLALTPVEHAAMARALLLTPAELAELGPGPLVEFDRTHLERAKTRLAGIDALGLQEHFEEFCDELSARFGWDLGEPAMVNTTAPIEVSDAFRARIAKDNAFDVELYEFAKGLLRDAGRLPPRADPERMRLRPAG